MISRFLLEAPVSWKTRVLIFTYSSSDLSSSAKTATASIPIWFWRGVLIELDWTVRCPSSLINSTPPLHPKKEKTKTDHMGSSDYEVSNQIVTTF